MGLALQVVACMGGVLPDHPGQVGRHLPEGEAVAAPTLPSGAQHAGIQPVLLVRFPLGNEAWLPGFLFVSLLWTPAPTPTPSTSTPAPSFLASSWYRAREVNCSLNVLVESETQKLKSYISILNLMIMPRTISSLYFPVYLATMGLLLLPSLALTCPMSGAGQRQGQEQHIQKYKI